MLSPSPSNASLTRKMNHTASERRRRERLNRCYQNLSNLVISNDCKDVNLTKLELLEKTIEYIRNCHNSKGVSKKARIMDIKFLVSGPIWINKLNKLKDGLQSDWLVGTVIVALATPLIIFLHVPTMCLASVPQRVLQSIPSPSNLPILLGQ